jgi:hypothetical protein
VAYSEKYGMKLAKHGAPKGNKNAAKTENKGSPTTFVSKPKIGRGSAYLLARLERDHKELYAKAADAADRKKQRPSGRPKKEVSPETVDNVHSSSRPEGNSQAKALRRLRKDRPDLYAKRRKFLVALCPAK